MMQPTKGSVAFAVFLLCSTFVLAVPYPAQDAKPEDAPLPGRTDTSIKNGVVTAHNGDDFMPGHEKHTADNQKEFPGNKKPFPSNPNPDKTRTGRLKDIADPGPHPVTGEPQVKDEKGWASQNNPAHSTDTTVRYLPKHESGGVRPKLAEDKYQANKKAFESVPANKGKKYVEHSPEMPDGSLRTEGAVATRTKSQIDKHEKEHGKGTGQIAIKPNPGWLKPDPTQQRAHEAPARMQTPPKVNGGSRPATPNSQGGTPPPSPKSPPGKQPAAKQHSGGESDQKPQVPPPERRPGLRPLKPGKNEQIPQPKAPAAAPTKDKGKGKDKINDPNGYLRPVPKIPQYKPGKLESDTISSTPHIGPPTNSKDRVPPRPQNRARPDPQQPNPPPKPAPPANGGAHEAPARLPGGAQTKRPADDKKPRPQPAGSDKPLGRPKPKPPPGGEGNKEGPSTGKKVTLPVRPAPLPEKGEASAPAPKKTVPGPNVNKPSSSAPTKKGKGKRELYERAMAAPLVEKDGNAKGTGTQFLSR